MLQKFLRLFPYVQHLEERNEIMNEGLEIAGRVEKTLRTDIAILQKQVKNDEASLAEERNKNEKQKAEILIRENVISYILNNPALIFEEKLGNPDVGKYVHIPFEGQETAKRYRISIKVDGPELNLIVRSQRR